MADLDWLVERYEAVREWASAQPQASTLLPAADDLLAQAQRFAESGEAPTGSQVEVAENLSELQAASFLLVLYANPIDHSWLDEADGAQRLSYAALEANLGRVFISGVMNSYPGLIERLRSRIQGRQS